MGDAQNVKIKKGTLVMAAFALELGRIRGEDYTNPNVVRPKYITRPEMIRIGVENGDNAQVNYFIAHPGSRQDWMTDEMLAPEGQRRLYSRFGVKLGVPGKVTQTQTSKMHGIRNPNAPRSADGTPRYHMDVFFDALDTVIADLPAERFASESQRVVLTDD